MKITSIIIKNYKNLGHVEIKDPSFCTVFESNFPHNAMLCQEIVEAIEFVLLVEKQGLSKAIQIKKVFRHKRKILEIVIEFKYLEYDKTKKGVYKIKYKNEGNLTIQATGPVHESPLCFLAEPAQYDKAKYEKNKREGKYMFFVRSADNEEIPDEEVLIVSMRGEKLVKKSEYLKQQGELGGKEL